MVSTAEAMQLLEMKRSAFYKLMDRLNITRQYGRLTDEDFFKMRTQHAQDKKMHAGKPRIWYRVSVNEGYGYFVKHVALTKKQAIQLVEQYREEGKCAILRACV